MTPRRRVRSDFEFLGPVVAVVVGSILIGLGIAYELGWLWVS